MTSIDLFYQGEGFAEIEHIELDGDTALAIIKTHLTEKHGLGADILIFIEDEDEPLDEGRCVRDLAGPAGVKLHLHRCRHIEVAVSFNGETVEHHFPPSATVARVKRWAAEHKFGMTEEEAGEHVLQIAGTHDRPKPGTHIGALTNKGHCKAAFDLVADERINGNTGTDG